MDNNLNEEILRQLEAVVPAVESVPWRASVRNADYPRPPDYAAPEECAPESPPEWEPQPEEPKPISAPPQAPIPQAPAARERILPRPANMFDMLKQHVHYDHLHNQMLRQNNPDGVRVIVPPPVFTPSAPPRLTPITDPTGLLEQVNQIKVHYPHVDWSLQAIRKRRLFLSRVENQRKTAFDRCMKQMQDWSRQEDEYLSLKEFDDAVEVMIKESESSKKLLGGKRSRLSDDDEMEL